MTDAKPFADHSIAHFDVAGPDLAALAKFYEAALGWTATSRGPGYSQLATPTFAGALMEAPLPALTIGVVVPDLDAALSRASAAGGHVEMPAVDNGWVRKAQVRDPAGNLITLIQNA